MNQLARILPWGVFALAIVYLLVAMTPAPEPEGRMHVHEFGALPVVDGDRFKPMDTFARIHLMLISGKQTFTDEDGATQPAVKWVLDVMTSQFAEQDPAPALKHKVFRIENEEVLALLGLEPRPGLRYALAEFKDKMDVLERETSRLRQVETNRRTKFDTKVLELAKHVESFIGLATWQVPDMVPPRSSGAAEDWKSFRNALGDLKNGQDVNPATELLRDVMVGYIANNPDTFNSKLAAYHKQIVGRLTGDAALTGFEVFFNYFDPFKKCAFLYGVVFLLAVCAWIGWQQQSLRQSAFLLGLVLLAVQTFGLAARMYIQGRPPVTNFYSSAVFIGWGAVGLCLGIEYVFRNGIGALVASILGGFTMIIAMHLAESGDTMEQLVAVLDTNFWLATHVTCVTLGYTATFVAGTIATVFILLSVLTRQDRVVTKTFTQIIYGVVCFATLLSFTGTVLGGIWADQSWGRFWGWDPKENGALLIVIWNALILHARWGGMIKDRGLAVLAVAGNMITAWSWFGTNQLSVGLHNYGFNNTLAVGCKYYWFSQLAIIGLGTLLPQRFWRSSSQALKPKPDVPPSALQPWRGGEKRGMATSG